MTSREPDMAMIYALDGWCEKRRSKRAASVEMLRRAGLSDDSPAVMAFVGEEKAYHSVRSYITGVLIRQRKRQVRK